MISQNHSRVMSMPEAPIYPTITKVAKKPIKTKKINIVDVSDTLNENPLDEATISDMVTPVNRGSVLPKKKAYTSKINKNNIPDVKLLRTIEGNARNTPRESVSIQAGKETTHTKIQETHIDKLLAGSSKFKNKRTTYTPRDDVSAHTGSNYSSVLYLPSDNEVLPDLKETLPRVSVGASKQYEWRKPQIEDDIDLKDKYHNPIHTSSTEVPFNKPQDVIEVSRARKYAEDLKYASRSMNYQKEVSSGADKLLLEQRSILRPSMAGTQVLGYHKPGDAREVELEDTSRLQPSYAVKEAVYQRGISNRRVELDDRSMMKPSSAGTTKLYQKGVSNKEIKLEGNSMMLPSHAGNSSLYQRGISNRDVELDNRGMLKPSTAGTSELYQQPISNRELELDDRSMQKPSVSSSATPYQRGVANKNVELDDRSMQKPSNASSVTPYQRGVANKKLELEGKNMNTSRDASAAAPYEKRHYQNTNIKYQDKRNTTYADSGHSGGYTTMEHIDSDRYTSEIGAAQVMSRQQKIQPRGPLSV